MGVRRAEQNPRNVKSLASLPVGDWAIELKSLGIGKEAIADTAHREQVLRI